MQKPLDTPPVATELTDLGAIRAQGPDAVKFLQGQLSNDVAKLATAGSMLAGFHNPQGRVIALLRLIGLGPDEIFAVLPRELAPEVVTRLSKFVLRAKVKLVDESAAWRVTGVTGPIEPREGLLVLPADPFSARSLLVSRADQAAPVAGYASLDRNGWRALDIATGMPQVTASTSEQFVAQMLNLDVLGAIAFDKGCYTGQEVIARAHYRGRVKRRMRRFRIPASKIAESPELKIIETVSHPDGTEEFLAVAPLDSPLPSLAIPYALPE